MKQIYALYNINWAIQAIPVILISDSLSKSPSLISKPSLSSQAFSLILPHSHNGTVKKKD